MVRTDSWRYLDSNGVSQPHTVTITYRDSGHPTETVAEWKQRFEDKVAADEILYPRITN